MNHSRRHWFRQLGVSISAVSLSGWLPSFAEAALHSHRKRSIIVLWLEGGPSTIDLWDLKPGHENGGAFKEIASVVPGVRISEHLSKLSTWTNDLAIVRSISSREGDHGRATQYAKTGYPPGGALQHPLLGALMSKELAEADSQLPGFVTIAAGSNTPRLLGSGFLGPRYAPLKIAEQSSSVGDLRVPYIARRDSVSRMDQHFRLSLLGKLEQGFQNRRNGIEIEGWHTSILAAERLMSPEVTSAFDLDQESLSTRDAYGRSLFGQGCLLARRLIEGGVSCVEVTLGGWDTHSNNFQSVKELSIELDNAFGSLLQDLKDRGHLENTLVLCMGEFGRTPAINSRGGRDHWPAVWSAAIAGGGIRGGQVIGKTSPDGTCIEEGEVSVPDLIATVCTSLGVDPRKQNKSNVGRPIRIADPDAKVIEELL